APSVGPRAQPSPSAREQGRSQEAMRQGRLGHPTRGRQASSCKATVSSFLSLQVESSEAPKDTASVPKCHPPCQEAGSAEPVPNGDLETDSAAWKGSEDGDGPQKSGQHGEDETDSLPDSETGQALENGRCTPKDSPEPPADAGKLALPESQEKRDEETLGEK
uniref:DNA (cytosine-5)-methyltransferase N-terminal domain-containing protein n=1 Tax=Pelusios castaneus TaxID=367368 RepID=A0A8C8SA02_9SAUR